MKKYQRNLLEYLAIIFIGEAVVITENSGYFSVFGTLKYDSYDNKYFPKKGWTFNSEIQSYLYSSDYTGQFKPFTIAKSEAGIAATFFKKATIKLQTEIGLSIGPKSITTLNFALGGYGNNTINNFKPFYGYDFLTLGANSYMKNMATIDVEFLKKNHLTEAILQMKKNLLS